MQGRLRATLPQKITDAAESYASSPTEYAQEATLNCLHCFYSAEVKDPKLKAFEFLVMPVQRLEAYLQRMKDMGIGLSQAVKGDFLEQVGCHFPGALPDRASRKRARRSLTPGATPLRSLASASLIPSQAPPTPCGLAWRRREQPDDHQAARGLRDCHCVRQASADQLDRHALQQGRAGATPLASDTSFASLAQPP